LIKEALDRVLELGKERAAIVDVDGLKVSATALHAVAPKVPAPEPLVVHTLDGLVDYVRSDLDALDDRNGMQALQVVDHGTVRLVESLTGPAQQRFVLVQATAAEVLGTTFRFGTFYDAETFVIAVQALFVDGEDRAQVLAAAGNIQEEGVKSTNDDGVTQTVVARRGVALKAERQLPNPVRLRPYRTFREIEQPASPFVLRAQDGPKLALFEADGGWWKLDAIAGIVKYLREQLGQELPLPIIR